MSRILPYPFVSAALLTTWLMMNQSVSPGQVLLGTFIAVLGGLTLSALDVPRLRFMRPLAALRLFFYVVADVVRSNFAVAAIILGLGHRERSSGFVDIPLALRNSGGLILLSFIITSTPGTVWVDFDPNTGILKIHVLDLVDQADWRNTIKGRYERLLLEMFE
jgi:multicomponent K+:H+ antiporter subunit E